jgi:hypothetical protein
MKIAGVLLFLFCFSFAYAQELSEEQKRLSFLRGSWTVEGSEETYLEVCDWIQGNHIQCISISEEENRVDSSISYLSYLAAEKQYVYYGLYPSGSSRTQRGKWDNDRFIFEGERVTPEKTTRNRVTLIPLDNKMRFIEEVSVNDAPWEKRADFNYIKLK